MSTSLEPRSTKVEKRARRKLSLTAKVAIGMAAGLALGCVFNVIGNQWINDNVVDGFLDMVGTAFLNALKMLVVPLVVFSLITGVTGIGDIRILGRVGGRPSRSTCSRPRWRSARPWGSRGSSVPATGST